jgi:hypothetical protein
MRDTISFIEEQIKLNKIVNEKIEELEKTIETISINVWNLKDRIEELESKEMRR